MATKSEKNHKVAARQLAEAIAYAVKAGKYVPLAPSVTLDVVQLDVMTQNALSLLLTIAALEGRQTDQNALLLLHEMRKEYPDLADMIDFVTLRLQVMETKQKVREHEQWVVSAMEPAVRSGELFKRLNYQLTR